MTESFDLRRFSEAQDKPYESSTVYLTALKELMDGQKQTHWMWFVFPQLVGLGRSENSWFYGIKNLAEARAYLNEATLGPRFKECIELLLAHSHRRPRDILGSENAAKLHACLTLFLEAAENPTDKDLISQVLRAFYRGRRHQRTFNLLASGK